MELHSGLIIKRELSWEQIGWIRPDRTWKKGGSATSPWEVKMIGVMADRQAKCRESAHFVLALIEYVCR